MPFPPQTPLSVLSVTSVAVIWSSKLHLRSSIIAGEKESISLKNIDFWMIKLGSVQVGPDKQQKVSEKQPVQIPDTPGFGAVFACISLLLVVMRILKKASS